MVMWLWWSGYNDDEDCADDGTTGMMTTAMSNMYSILKAMLVLTIRVTIDVKSCSLLPLWQQ